jgi:hypothetical protein
MLSAPNFSGLSVVITVASSAPVRHGLPGGITSDSARPLRDGRPYSTEMFAPSIVHALFTCGLPPLPGCTSVVFCASRVVPNVAATAAAAKVRTHRRMQPPVV